MTVHEDSIRFTADQDSNFEPSKAWCNTDFRITYQGFGKRLFYC